MVLAETPVCYSFQGKINNYNIRFLDIGGHQFCPHKSIAIGLLQVGITEQYKA